MLKSGLLAAILAFAGWTPAAEPGAPNRLRVIDSYEQLGIDQRDPRFGWVVVDSDRGESQSEYQIVVASSLAKINGDAGDRWNSGWMKSSAQTDIAYAGNALSSCTQYWYKVRTKDKDGNASPWSDIASFSTGFLAPSDWDKGTTWIQSTLPEMDIAKNPMFRREFSLTKKLRRATMYMCGLGHYELFINGSRIGDHILDPLWSEYTKTCYYATYDVTANLAVGGNAIGVTLGNGFYNGINNPRYCYCQPNYGPKKLIAELHVDYEDGSTEKIVSDANWKFAQSPIVFSSIYGGEDYDARMEQPGWDRAGFKDAAWTAAVACKGPGGALVSQFAPPVKVQKVFTPKSHDGEHYDFPIGCSGQPQIAVSGEAGSVVRIGPMGCGGYCLYTLKGGSKEVWHPAFYYDLAGRVDVTVISGKANVESVALRYVYNASDPVGEFACSDEWIMKIHGIVLEAMRCNTQGVHTDCPHREKLGWQSTVQLIGPSLMYNYDVSLLWSKSARDCRDSMRADGTVPATSPNYLGMGPDPAWSSSVIISPWLVYRNTGATRQLADGFEGMKTYDKTLGDRILTEYRWGDWGNPSAYVDSRATETAISYYDSKIIAQTAALLGHVDESSIYAAQAERIKNAYNLSFLNRAGYYGWGDSPTEHSPQDSNVMALDFDLVPAGKETAVLNHLRWLITERDHGHIGCGETSLPSLWRSLNKYEQNELAYSMIMQPDAPSFKAFFSVHQLSALPEFFGNGATGGCHDMFGHVEEWFYGALAGLSSTNPGYEEIRIAPHSVGGMTSCSASVMTVRGLVSSKWTKKAGEFGLEVTIPVNSKAVVVFPRWGSMSLREGSTTIWQNGKSTGKAPGLSFASSDDLHVSWSAGSGTYSFVLTGTEPAAAAPPVPPTKLKTAPLLNYADYLNVAAAKNGATVTASSEHPGGYAAAGAINGNRTSSDWSKDGGWADNTSGAWPDSIEVKFAEAHELREIDVFSYGGNDEPTLQSIDGQLNAFDVEYWDGKKWVLVPEGDVRGSFLRWNRISLAKPIRTERIRITVLYSFTGDFSRVNEIEAWSAKGTPK